MGTCRPYRGVDARAHRPKAWQDVTTSIDSVNHVISGTTTSLSPFTVVALHYDFARFLAPVDNPPVRNAVKAGQAVPVKFTLGSDRGLDIMATGSPGSYRSTATAGAP